MRFRRKKEEEPLLSITPLIDIVFLLLIFFMLTSHFHVASGVPIRLPKVTQNAYDGKSQEVILAIDREGRFYLKGEKADPKELGPKLKDLVDKGELAQLVLQADKEVQHGRVVQAMDLAKSAGVSSIIIAAQWDPKKDL
jgi:biopolymer transport protein ExbD